MAPRVLNIPLTLGRADRVDPKYAPLGVLATAKNLRVRKDGRLACRTGYVLQDATTEDGTLVAYDLHEYKGRLLALGSDAGDGYPVDIFERTEGASNPWLGADLNPFGSTVTLTPFTNARGIPVVPMLAEGASRSDIAAGGGFVAYVYHTGSGTQNYLVVARQSDGQIILREAMLDSSSIVKATFSVNTFYFAVAQSTGTIVIRQFLPSTDATTLTFATVVTGGTAVLSVDLVPVTNPTTARVVVAYSKAADARILKFNSSGAQVGGTITVALANVDQVVAECDEADDTINLYTRVVTTCTLRTYDFTAETLSLGPTACTAATSGSMCRLPVLGINPQAIAIASNTSAGNVEIAVVAQSDHSGIQSFTVSRATLRGRLCEGQSGAENRCVVFSGLVAPQLPTLDFASDALFFIGASQAHMVTRNPQSALSGNTHQNLMLDSSTGKLAWLGFNDLAGDDLSQPSIVTVDFRSAERRQSARYGGFLYLAGATVQAYDGIYPTELCFNELPGIISATPDTGGSLTASAEYDYVHHWEFTRPDGTFERSPVSEVFSANTGALQTENNFVLSTPHSIRSARSSSLFGAGVLSVLSRTVWNAANSTKSSEFRRCKVTAIPGGLANYGATLAVVDNLSDATLATRGVVYTQGARNALSGPVEDDAPESCSYITADASRIFTGGLARTHETQVSKPPDIEQPFAFSNLSAFFNLVSEEVNGVGALSGVKLVFTKNQIYALGGGGPDDQGGGALEPPQELSSAGGLHDWRSMLLEPGGLWFQLDATKLYRLPLGGGPPEWLGIDIQDTLSSYPVITGAARCKLDDAVAFACENTGSADGRIVVRSLRTGLWTEDTPPLQTSQGIEAMCSYGETLAYVSGGRVYVQHATSFADGASTVIPTAVKTHPIYPFELGGNGSILEMLVTGEYRSAGTLALRVSYDDGVTFTTYDSFTLTGLTAGQTIQRKWSLQQDDITSAVFELTYTPSAVGEGFIMHGAALLVATASGLKDLNPSECA